MKDKILYSLLGVSLLLTIFIVVRVEALHSTTNNLKTNIQTLTDEQNNIKSIISNKSVRSIASGKTYKIDIGNSVVLGNRNAPITIIKWTDFQCPYCAKSSSLVTKLLEKYPNDVKVVVKNFPLSSHKQAMAAAKYSLAAHKQGKYKEMYNKIFTNYRSLKTNERLPEQYAAELGLNLQEFLGDFTSQEIQNQINTEIKQLRNSGMRLSVPKFLINGKEPQGPRTVDNWSTIINIELQKLKS
tara:strand:- start:2764 stop:3489 length:726 start_codon:yes stop_codon:yes gene_type:complete